MATSNPYALNFSGNSKVTMPTNAVLNFNQTSAFTLECWIKISKIGSTMTVFNKQKNTTNEFVIGIDISATGVLTFGASKQGVTTIAAYSTRPLDVNKWYHVAGVSDGLKITLYLDGVLQQTTVITYTGATQSLATLIIGNWYYNELSYFYGAIDDFRIWNVAKTQLEIQSSMRSYLTGKENGLILHYRMDEGGGLTISDTTTYGNVGTLVNTTWVEGEGDFHDSFLLSVDNEFFSFKTIRSTTNIMPHMASNTSDSVKLTSSIFYGDDQPWKAFDRGAVASRSQWYTNSAPPVGGHWLKFEFAAPIRTNGISLMAFLVSSGSASLKDFIFYGSNDDVNYTNIISGTHPNLNYDVINYRFSNKNIYKFYRLNIITSYLGTSNVGVMEMEIFGADKKELLQVSTLTESHFLKYGIDYGSEIALSESISERVFIDDSPTVLGSGKVFKQSIDTSKVPIKNVSIT
ncbi:LamG domain-containing protein [Paenibacillus sp. FSL E2-0178]|uniref:LamG domain-containing protein n=1 Tax=Paenibacillus sp. FSL E2-0178 TaxID=2921361 RepID=UPI003158457D